MEPLIVISLENLKCRSPRSQDIMVRRTREFDRSGFHSDLLGAVVPNRE